MSGTASVFYGQLANAFSLLKAARAHQLIRSELLALDIIIMRRQKGTLSNHQSRLSQLPVKIFLLIKEEIYATGLADVLWTWANEYADWATNNWEELGPYGFEESAGTSGRRSERTLIKKKEQAQEKAEAVRRTCMAAAATIRSSSDWVSWAGRVEFKGYEPYTKHRYGLDEFELLESLYFCCPKEIRSFLSVFSMRAVGDTFDVKDSPYSESCLSDLCVPVALSKEYEIHLYFDDRDWDTYSQDDIITLPQFGQKFAKKPFDILFEKYQVEFVPDPDVSPEDDEGESERSQSSSHSQESSTTLEVNRRIGGPNPTWKLHCEAYTEMI